MPPVHVTDVMPPGLSAPGRNHISARPLPPEAFCAAASCHPAGGADADWVVCTTRAISVVPAVEAASVNGPVLFGPACTSVIMATLPAPDSVRVPRLPRDRAPLEDPVKQVPGQAQRGEAEAAGTAWAGDKRRQDDLPVGARAGGHRRGTTTAAAAAGRLPGETAHPRFAAEPAAAAAGDRRPGRAAGSGQPGAAGVPPGGGAGGRTTTAAAAAAAPPPAPPAPPG